MDVGLLIADQVRLRGDAVAVRGVTGQLTYAKLGTIAGRVAASLARAVPDDVVALELPRGPELIAAIVGVLWSGAAYLPLDPAAPRARTQHMKQAAKARFTITSVEDTESEDIEGEATPRPAHPSDLAYAVFTSGSTGEPKPVAVSRGALSNHCAAITARYGLTAADRVLQFAAPAFDVFAEEVLPTLACGGQVVVMPDAARLTEFIEGHGITVVNLPTPYWAQWTRDLDRRLPQCLRLVVIGSEVGHAATLRAFQKHSLVPVINAYGLSESTITATTAELSTHDIPDPLPIGQPIDGAEALILDSGLRPADEGELYLGGAALARGYLGRARLTADRFVPHPTVDGARLYRTGDLVRRLPGQGLQFLGRGDDQIKVRGHRIEPLEVESALCEHADVLAAHVLAEADSLVAYVVPRDPRRVPTLKALREHMEQRVPGYLRPNAVVLLDAMPLLDNGKVDRDRLPRARVRRAGAARPATGLQARIAVICEEVLCLERIGADEDLFELGGHSLTAARIAELIHRRESVQITVVEVLTTPTVAALAALAEERRGKVAALPAVSTVDRSEAPLSRQQEQVLFLTRLAPDSIAYHTPTTIRVAGPLDLDVLDRTVTELARRHAILRTTYAGGRQIIHPPGPISVVRVDARGRREEAEALVEAELRRPFDVTKLPLIRWTAIRLGPLEHEIVLVEHHLVHDGWSFALLMRELKAIYNALLAGVTPDLPEPSAQYHDYAVWQRTQLSTPDGVLAGQLAYWREQLAELPAPLTLVPDRPRPLAQTFTGQTLRLELPPALPAQIRRYCRDNRVTLFTAMYAAFAALMHRCTGERDVCLGSAFACRQVPGTHDVLGMFVNPVLLRCDITGDLSYQDVVDRCRDVIFAAASHQEFPFPELVRELNPGRDPSGSPLMRVMFSANDSALPELDLGPATGTVFERGNGSARMDFDVVVVPRAESQQRDSEHVDERIMLLWEFNADLFDESTMTGLAGRYLKMLETAVTEPRTRIRDLPMTTAAEEHLVRTEWQGAQGIAFRDVVSQVLEVRPDRLAIESLTYGELVSGAKDLAAGLGAGPGEVVGILLPRGAELVMAELAVLMTGAAFAPLDPSTPPERLALCRSEADLTTIVTSIPACAGRDFTPVPVVPGDPAYVIFTSGSTGTPKAVLVSHGSLSNLVAWQRCELGLSHEDRLTLLASPSFDVSISEIWPTLSAGASLHVPGDHVRLAPTRLREWLHDKQITVTDVPTPLAEPLLTERATLPASLRAMLVGGDRLTVRPRPEQAFEVINAYGPTEATVTATSGRVGRAAPARRLPSIGRPIEAAKAYVLDDNLRPVAPGLPGELYLGGAGVALGYLGRAGHTAERFVPDPFGSGERLYRTGDRARHLPDGRLEFLGRVDDQVKLRGYRIEPGEIVAALLDHPGVDQGYVSLMDGRLVAHVSGREAPLRDHLARRLPAYMIPSSFVWLDRLPVSRSGKVDRARLPAPVIAAREHQAGNDTERALVAIWADVLELETVGVHDNFFDLGGHSLLLGRVHERIAAGLSRELPLIALFQYPTISALARHLASGSPAGDASRELRARVDQLARRRAARRG